MLIAQEPPVRVDTTKIVVPDSLSREWTTRSPLTAEQQQRRADKRAELADMKKRFRRFQNESSDRQNNERTAAEEENYLWSDAETGGQPLTTEPKQDAVTPGVKPEELRMEISRNLQEGRNPNASVPSAPVLPAYVDDPVPAAYDMVDKGAPQAPQELQKSIQSSLRQPSTQNPDWQARVGSTSVIITNPADGIPLRAGQIILLEQVRFANGSSQLYPDAATSLVQWAKLLQQQPALRIEVRAYTHGNEDTNMALQLTRERAENIAAYWQQLGVKNDQISYRGYGQLSPLVPEGLPGAQQKNERIELIILELPTH